MARSYVQTKALAVSAIEEQGALLVYPLANRRDPPSLWRVLHPRVEMRWAWDQGADDRVVKLWQLREELAREKRVVYGKWYRGRATFFSRTLFVDMLAVLQGVEEPLSDEANELLALLRDDSPQSTKALRREAGLSGRAGEHVWTRALRELWERCLIVGVGEIDDGAFPSLAVGATQTLFEDLWDEAQLRSRELAQTQVQETLSGTGVAFLKMWRASLTARAKVTARGVNAV
ncbi:MAG: hypothetical protein QM778_26395 [Myxococcales bacterium]